MASQVDIVNEACILLGATPVTAITDNSNQARAFSAVWNTERDGELRKHLWKFAMARAALPALASVPASGPYTQQYAVPSGCLRVITVGDSWPAADVSDYRSGPTTDDYSVEGGLILSNLPAPLSVRYVQQITDPGLFDAAFAQAFAARLAYVCCFRITSSLERQKEAAVAYKDAIREAIRANALESTPVYPGDDTWVSVRMAGAGSNAIVNF